MTFDELVAKCKSLRGIHERAEAQFFVILREAEVAYEQVWKEAGCSTFDQFLMSNHLCEPKRYRFFAIGLSRVGVDEAISNGAPWTVQRGRMDSEPREALEAFSERARAFVELEGVAPSDQTVRGWKAETTSKNALEHRTIQRVDELHRLREENKRLKADLAAAKKRIDELEGKGKEKRGKGPCAP